MSEDTIDSFFVAFVSVLEGLPQNWMDDDETYDVVFEWVHNWLEPYCTKERNYN